MAEKKRTWLVIGHTRGVKEKDRKLASQRWVYPISKAEALIRAKKSYTRHTVTRVKAGSY